MIERPWRACLMGLLLTGTAGCADTHSLRQGLEAWMDARFDGVTRQRYASSCAAAAVSTVLTHHCGDPIDEREAVAAMLADRRARGRQGGPDDDLAAGFSMLDMVRLLRARGYAAHGYRGTFESELARGRPLIVRLERLGIAHFSVLVAIRGGRAYLADSIDGRVSLSLAELAAQVGPEPVFVALERACTTARILGQSAPTPGT